MLQGERQFSRDNKLLGEFHLDGIAPAPRGIPQIEVTFDIDANGIVNVTAMDKGTGKQQHITITSSTSMSKEDIDKAVKDAEMYAEEDKKRREEVDTRNEADNIIFQTEKTLGDIGDKVSESDKQAVKEKIEQLRSIKDTGSVEEVKEKTEAVKQELYKLSEQLYQQAQASGADMGGQPGPDMSGAGTSDDFNDVNDN